MRGHMRRRGGWAALALALAALALPATAAALPRRRTAGRARGLTPSLPPRRRLAAYTVQDFEPFATGSWARLPTAGVLMARRCGGRDGTGGDHRPLDGAVERSTRCLRSTGGSVERRHPTRSAAGTTISGGRTADQRSRHQRGARYLVQAGRCASSTGRRTGRPAPAGRPDLHLGGHQRRARVRRAGHRTERIPTSAPRPRPVRSRRARAGPTGRRSGTAGRRPRRAP